MLKFKNWVIAGCALSLLACEPSAEKAEATRVEETPARELTPRDRVALYQTQFGVINALTTASLTALRKIDSDPAEPPEKPADLVGADTKQFTVFFAANNHGEREDCGCRKNPLGGLARRHTLVNLLRGGDPAEVMKWWNRPAAEGPVFHVDAGDGLYKAATVGRGTPQAQSIAKADADAVIDALNISPPDAYLVGELDVAFGADQILAYAKEAKFPLISANLRGADGKPMFPGHVVVERDGNKIGVVGLTRQKTRDPKYWSSMELSVEDPLETAKAEIAKLPADVDLVVVLSNLGLTETESTLEALRGAGVRADFAVVSGTNRLTTDPQFIAGTPMVEPLSQGKYLGRADFTINGDAIDYRNASAISRSQVADYRRELRNYHMTRKQVLRNRQKLAELEMTVDTIEKRSDANQQSAAAGEELKKKREEGIETQKKRIETSENRLAAVSEGLLKSIAVISKPREVTGDDWVEASLVPVKIEIPEEKQTRKVLDKAASKRPKEAMPAGLRKPTDASHKALMKKGLPKPVGGTLAKPLNPANSK